MTANGTYTNGLLSTSYTGAATCSQAVVLKAGTYTLNGKVNRGGAAVVPKVHVSGGTDGTVLDTDFTKATISSDDSVQDNIDTSVNRFTLTASTQTVTFTLSIVGADNSTLASGAAHIRFILEADTGNQYPVIGQQ